MSPILKEYVAWVALTDGEIVAAADIRLETDQRGRHLSSGMRYRPEWLAHPKRYPFNPAHLPLTATPIEWETRHIPALIDEGLPGRWERAVQQRRWAGRADIDDLHAVLARPRELWRVGSLEILPANMPPPPLTSSLALGDIDMLMQEVASIEQHQAPELQTLARMQAGSSVGGARPKVLLEDDGAWLAKFQMSGDTFNQVRVEQACLLLAARAGIEVADSRVERVGDQDVLLLKRFDVTDSGGRCGLVSANALLKDPRHQNDPPHPGYEDLVECVRRFSTRVERDLKLIYAQMLFNEAINNRDDHLKNFSFLVEPSRQTLSPAYDLVPSETLGAYPQLDFGHRPSLPAPASPEAITAAAAFGLSPSEARIINERIAEAFGQLEVIFEQAGLAAAEQRFLIQRLPEALRPQRK